MFSCHQEKVQTKLVQARKSERIEITESERLGMEQIRRLDSLHAIGKF